MPPVSANAVLALVQDHIQKCEVANVQTANALKDLARASDSMAKAHEAMAVEMASTRKEFQDNWTALNRNAWRALGAIGLTILAGGVGVVVQNVNLHNASTAKTEQAQAVILQKLDTLQPRVGQP